MLFIKGFLIGISVGLAIVYALASGYFDFVSTIAEKIMGKVYVEDGKPLPQFYDNIIHK